ncbi:MAG: hypothetical protein OXQ29_27240 [Rhodospirillaceae bacterium]|nr:hypothetical protein [Rhodospirillaceae bacterium]
MKKVDQFSREETGEEWLRELYKVVARRRGVMFRLIDQSARMLLIGNAGGAALIVGFMSAAPGSQDTPYHWFALGILAIFGTGILTSSLTTVLVALIAVKEAHGAETGLKQFVDGEIDRSEVLFVVDEQGFRLADFATLLGAVSVGTFMAGGLASIVMLMLFF